MRNLLTSFLVLLGLLAQAQAITPDKSMSAALDFYNSISPEARESGHKKAPRTAVTASDLVKTRLQEGALEAFNVKEGRGFVLVAPDGDSPRIVGYSDRGSFDASNLPPQLKKALENPLNLKQSKARSKAPGTPVVKHETAEWGQYAPFNDLCPTIDGQKAPAGCVATAMAIAMKYHNWPDCTRGGVETDFYFPDEMFDFDAYTIDWDALGNTENPAFARQAAELTYSAGIASQMLYGAIESGAEVWTLGHLFQYFYAYDKNCQHIPRDKFDDTRWEAILKEQLEDVGPVVYDGFGDTGHCFVIDGYDSEGMYHVNWGWDGGSNGYYSLDFSIEGGMSFGERQGMIINMKPDREKKVYSKAFVPNDNVYSGGETSGWNFLHSDFVEGESNRFVIPPLTIGDFRGYLRFAIVDENDNIVKLTDTWTHLDGYRYFCPHPGTSPEFTVNFPALNEGEHYQMVTQEAPNEFEGPASLETGYYPAIPPSENPEDWNIVTGGIIHSSGFYMNGNRSVITEVRLHIDEKIPSFCVNKNTFDHELTDIGLKGSDWPQNIIVPRKGVKLEVTAADKDGNPKEALYVGQDNEFKDNIIWLNVALYEDQYDINLTYEFDGDTRKDSDVSKDLIVEKDGLVYKKDEGHLTLIGYDIVNEEVTIPYSINVGNEELPVTEIGTEALLFAPIKHLDIKPTSLRVNQLAFAGTEQLESITFDNIDAQHTSFESVPFVNSGLKTVYFNAIPRNFMAFDIVTSAHYISDTLSIAKKNVDFILTELPESGQAKECFNAIRMYCSYIALPEDPTDFGIYTIPGIGDEQFIKYTQDIPFKIRQMWSYAIDRKNGVVRLDNVIENVKIESILINGEETEDRGNGVYAVLHAIPTRSKDDANMAVTVNYTVNGKSKSTIYSPEFNDKISNTNLAKKVESIQLNPETWNGTEGDMFRIEATVLPEDATDKGIEWSSSDESIATVDTAGTVMTLSAGEAVITATATDGSGVKATCLITSASGVDRLIGEEERFDVYNLNGVLLIKDCDRENLKLLTPDIYFIRQGKSIKKIILR